MSRGRALSALGRAEEAVLTLAEVLGATRALGGTTSAHFAVIWYGYVLGQVGRGTEGLEHLSEVARHIETTEERWFESDMHRVRGELLARIGAPEAQKSLELAMAVAQKQNSKFLELRAALSLAGFWRDQGKRAEAHDHLGSVYGWFTEGFDTPMLKEAKALLEQLSP